MKYKYRILYKPPIEELDDNNPDTWRKVFYLTPYDCPEKLDLRIKVSELINTYNMKEEYITIEEFLDESVSCE